MATSTNYPLTSFIGAGNMASSIIAGMLAAGVPRSRIRASAPSESSRERLHRLHGIATFSDNLAAADGANIVVFAVKPQVLRFVSEAMAGHITDDVLVVSIAAGITCQTLRNWTGVPALAVVRCMPNTPSAVGQGACGIFATANVTVGQRVMVRELMAAVGQTVWLQEEALLDAVTALSGSGPAYFLLMMEAMIRAGEKLGLSHADARKLCIQTAFGGSMPFPVEFDFRRSAG